jgi:hypothetical protein
MPKFGRDRADNGHRTTIANRSSLTDAVEKGLENIAEQ